MRPFSTTSWKMLSRTEIVLLQRSALAQSLRLSSLAAASESSCSGSDYDRAPVSLVCIFFFVATRTESTHVRLQRRARVVVWAIARIRHWKIAFAIAVLKEA